MWSFRIPGKNSVLAVEKLFQESFMSLSVLKPQLINEQYFILCLIINCVNEISFLGIRPVLYSIEIVLSS